MQITKHEHACLVLEKGGRRLVLDPGSFTTPLFGISDVDGVVITHEHPDHWTPEQLDRVLELNPGIHVFGPQGVADAVAASESTVTVTVVSPGDEVQVGDFKLRFFGGAHAIIHSSIPGIQNVGVLVDDVLYVPGDSLEVPDVEVDTLAVPSSAPWLKIGEAMDFVLAVKPKRAFPVHEMVNSQAGKQMANGRLKAVTEQGGGEYVVLEPQESYEL